MNCSEDIDVVRTYHLESLSEWGTDFLEKQIPLSITQREVFPMNNPDQESFPSLMKSKASVCLPSPLSICFLLPPICHSFTFRYLQDPLHKTVRLFFVLRYDTVGSSVSRYISLTSLFKFLPHHHSWKVFQSINFGLFSLT